METEKPKIALVYHDTGDKKRLPFLTSLMELISLVEPGVTCEIYSTLRLVFEEQVHDARKVAVFLFSEDTDFPAYPTNIRAYFNLKNDTDLLIVSQRRTPTGSQFPPETIFHTKNLLKKPNDWCPGFFKMLFPKESTEAAPTNDVVFVCNSSSKGDVSWCKELVKGIEALGAKAVCPGTPEWASADEIMEAIKPTTLVVLVVNKDGLDLLMKFGPLIDVAKERAKVVIATKNERKVSSDLRGSDICVYSREQPIDLWLAILSHLSLVSCRLQVPSTEETSTGFVMPFAKGKLKTIEGALFNSPVLGSGSGVTAALAVEESGECNWKTCLFMILLLLFIPIVIGLYVVAILYGIDLTKLSKLGDCCATRVHAV